MVIWILTEQLINSTERTTPNITPCISFDKAIEQLHPDANVWMDEELHPDHISKLRQGESIEVGGQVEVRIEQYVVYE